MKRIKKIFKGVINWFKVKWQNKGLKKYVKELETKIISLEEEIIKLEDLTDKNLNVQRIKDLKIALEHEREIKRQLRVENKELRIKLKNK